MPRPALAPAAEANPELALAVAVELEIRRRQKEHSKTTFFDQYRTDPEGYIRNVLGWTPWSGDDEHPGQVQIIEAYRTALLKQLERRDYELGVLQAHELAHYEPGETIRNWIRVEAGHTVGKCVAASDDLTLADGSLVKAGDLIGTEFDLLTLEAGRQRVVRARAEFNAVEPVYALTTDSGRRVVRNAEHPFWTTRGTFRAARKPVIPEGGFAPLIDLKPGDLVAVAATLEAEGDRPMPDEEIKLLAYLIGDGGYTRGLITFSQQDNAQLEEFRALAEGYGCVLDRLSAYDYKITGAGRRRTRFNPILNLLRAHGLMGKHSRDKRVPSEIFSLPLPKIALFLNRLYSTDGWACVTTRAEIGFCSASYDLVRDIQRLLQRFGIHGTVTRRTKVAAWTLNVLAGQHVAAFCRDIGIYGKEAGVAACAERVRDTARRDQWREKNAPEGTRWERVVSVEPCGVEATVAVEVPGPETFLTEFYEHNTKVAAGIVNHFYDCYRPSITYTFAPTKDQIKDLLWKEIKADRQGKGLPGRILDLRLDRPERADWFAQGKVASASENGGSENVHGQHGPHMLMILDEAEGIPGYVWDALNSLVSGGIAVVILLANPRTRSSRFHYASEREDVVNLRVSCLWHPNVVADREIVPGAVMRRYVNTMLAGEAEVVDEHRAEDHTFEVPWRPGVIYKPTGEFMYRVLGEAPTQSTEKNIISEAVYTAAVKGLTPRLGGRADAYVGIDCARYGNDNGTIWVRHDGEMWRHARIVGQDTLAYIREAKALAHDLRKKGATRIRFRIDGTGGYGGGIVDQLRRDIDLSRRFEDYRVLEVHFQKKSRGRDTYADVITECYGETAETLKGVRIRNPPKELRFDLIDRRFEFTNMAGLEVKELEDKDDFRERHKRSPDDGDGFVLAAAPDTVFQAPPRKPVRSRVKRG